MLAHVIYPDSQLHNAPWPGFQLVANIRNATGSCRLMHQAFVRPGVHHTSSIEGCCSRVILLGAYASHPPFYMQHCYMTTACHTSAALRDTCLPCLQTLSCRALAGNSGTLPQAWAARDGPALARAVCILDGPLQEGEPQARLIYRACPIGNGGCRRS